MEEVDRISQAMNFNGIELLNGKMNRVDGASVSDTYKASAGAAFQSAAPIVEGSNVEGLRTSGAAAIKSEQYFYMPDTIMASNKGASQAGETKFTITLKDGKGQTNVITVDVKNTSAGAASLANADPTSLSMKAIADGINATTNTGATDLVIAKKNATDSTNAGTGVTITGTTGELKTWNKMKAAYTFSYDENTKILTVKAANAGPERGVESISTFTTEGAANKDKETMEAGIKQKYETGTEGSVTLGLQTKESIKGVTVSQTAYREASIKITLGA